MTSHLLEYLERRLQVGPDRVGLLVDRADRIVARLTLPEGSRVAKVATERDAFGREAAAMNRLREAGVPVSDVITVEAGPPSLLVVTWAEGAPISASTDSRTLAAVGTILRTVHEMPAKAPWSGHPSLERWIEAWLEIVVPWWESTGQASANDRRVVWEWFGEMRPWLGNEHGSQMLFDGRPDHFLVGPDGDLHLIDVADLQAGDPVMDLAVLELEAPGILPGILTGYRPSPTEQQRITAVAKLYVMLRALSGAEWQTNIGGDPVAIARYLAVARKLADQPENRNQIS